MCSSLAAVLDAAASNCRVLPKLGAQFMNVLDLIKATLACGITAYLIYSFPALGQVLIIGLLSVLWLSYAHRTLSALRRR